MKSSFKKILSVFTSLVIFSSASNASTSNNTAHSHDHIVRIIGSNGNEVNEVNEVYIPKFSDWGTNQAFSIEEIVNLRQNGDYLPDILHQALALQNIPSNSTIGYLINKVNNAINSLEELKNNNDLDDDYKRQLMKTVCNLLNTYVYLIARLQDAIYKTDENEYYSSSEYDVIFLVDSINSQTFNNFDSTIDKLRYKLNDERMYDFYHITIQQTEARNFSNYVQNELNNNQIIQN